MLNVKDKAPDFTLQDQFGNLVSLNSFLGKKVVLYFYPKDDTPGCTRQACSFRDNYEEFKNLDVVVIGISKDDLKSHQKFASKYNLPFILLADPDQDAINKYQVLKEKKMFGKAYMGVSRTTYIIDEQGYIEKVFKDAKPDTNSTEIIEYLANNK